MAIALIVAAGSGERLGADCPKALVEVAGRPMLAWSVGVLRAMAEVEQIVVALPFGAGLPQACREGVIGVEGGASRSESVRCALEVAAPEGPVLVHDAARPLLTAAIVRRVLDALAGDDRADAAIAAAPVTDTIKRLGGDGGVVETLDRRSLWAVQTPQAFHRGALERALAAPSELLARATDDAWLIERMGGRVVVAEIAEENLKVTTPRDLERVQQVLARRADTGDPA